MGQQASFLRWAKEVEEPGSDRIAVIGLRRFPNYIGGIETHCEQLYTSLISYPQAPSIDIFMRGSAQDAEYLPGLRVHNVRAPRIFGVETFIYSFISLLMARLWLRISLIHFHGIGPAIFSPVAKLLGAKVVVTHHAADYERPKWGALGRFLLIAGERLAAQFADRVVCISHVVATEFLGRYPHAATKTTVICHGLKSAEIDQHIVSELGLKGGGFLFAAGRFDRTKRFEDVIEAHQKAHCELPLVIAGKSAGEPDYDEQLFRMAGPHVIFAGFMNPAQMAALYTHAAVFIHASQMEGCGLVVLEALRARTPVLVSDIPAHREFGLAEDHFFVTRDVNALSQKLRQPFSRESTATYANIDRNHDFSAMVQAHRQIYATLAQSPRKALQ